MVRLCYTSGIDIKVESKNGQLITEGPGSENQRKAILFALEFANLSQFTTVKTNDDCIERFMRNESDFSTGLFDMNDSSGKYFVAVPAISSTLYFLSGYNVFKYEKEEKEARTSRFGVLDNFGSFSSSVYFLIFTWMATLVALTALGNCLFRPRWRGAQWRRAKRAIRTLVDSATGRSAGRWPLVKFNFFLGSLLLGTPFCLLFKTEQVVIRKPFLISTYDEIIGNEAQIVYTTINMNDSLFLQQSTGAHGDDTMNRIWKYFSVHSREVAIDRTPESLNLIESIARGISEKKIVFAASYGIAESFRQGFCSWSSHPNLYQVLMFHDTHQREIINGYAFRDRRASGKLIKKLRRAFESHVPSHLVHSIDNYVGIEILPNPDSHQQHQLALCQRRELINYQKEQVLASDLDFFTNIFECCSMVLVMAMVLLYLEKILGRVRRISKWKNVGTKLKVTTQLKRIHRCPPCNFEIVRKQGPRK